MKKPVLRSEVFQGDRVPREAPPPSRWGQSRTGSATFVVRKVGWRNPAGKKLYRLGFYETADGRALFSSHLWTLEQLVSQGVQWLDKCPIANPVEEEEPDRLPAPEGAELDTDDDVAVEAAIVGTMAVADQILKHKKSGNLYKVHEVLAGGIVVVSQVKDVPTPKRKLAATAFEVMP